MSYWHSGSESIQVTVDDLYCVLWSNCATTADVSLIFSETPRSIRAKVSYLEQHDMRGMVFWTLSQIRNGSSSTILELDASFNPAESSMTATATMHFEPTARAVPEVVFLLHGELSVEAVAIGTMKIELSQEPVLYWLRRRMGREGLRAFTRELFASDSLTYAVFRELLRRHLPDAEAEIDLWLETTDLPPGLGSPDHRSRLRRSQPAAVAPAS